MLTLANAQTAAPRGKTSYAPVTGTEDFDRVVSRMSGQKAKIMSTHASLLEQRYDLSNRAAAGVTMARGKPVQGGVRVRLPEGKTWQQLAAMMPADIHKQNMWPKGFYPLPHPNHPEGGMLFPKYHIAE